MTSEAQQKIRDSLGPVDWQTEYGRLAKEHAITEQSAASLADTVKRTEERAAEKELMFRGADEACKALFRDLGAKEVEIRRLRAMVLRAHEQWAWTIILATRPAPHIVKRTSRKCRLLRHYAAKIESGRL